MLITGKGSKAAANFLRLLYQSVQWANVADNARDGPLGNIYYGLNKIVTSTALNQNTNEAAYEGYARQAVARSAGGHVLMEMAPTITLASALSFPRALGGEEAELVYFHTGSNPTGIGEVFHCGPLDPPILSRRGVVPQLLPETSITEC